MSLAAIKSHPFHPLKPAQHLVFALLEPFAERMWRTEIAKFSRDAGTFHWRKQINFGGFFQKVVVEGPERCEQLGRRIRSRP